MSKPTRKRKPIWRKVSDTFIRHRWDLDCDCEDVEQSVYVAPTFYEDSGTPICQDCGQDRKYAGTEIQSESERPIKPITITITLEGGVIQDIQHIPTGIRVKVLDFDTEGVPVEDLTKLGNGQRAVVSVWGKR